MIKKIIYIAIAAINLLPIASYATSSQYTIAVVNSDNDGDMALNKSVASVVRSNLKSTNIGVNITEYSKPFEATKGGENGKFDIVYAPSQVIASLVHKGFIPYEKTIGETSSVFVVPTNSTAKSIADLRGKSILLPRYDSLVSGLARAEFTKNNLGSQSFSKLTYLTINRAAVYSLLSGTYDAAVTDKEDAQKWIKIHGGRIIAESESVSTNGFAAKENVPKAMIDSMAKVIMNGNQDAYAKLVLSSTDDYKAIGSMLNVTPNSIAGAVTIDTVKAKDLNEHGTLFIDVRSNALYQQSHVRNAISVEYKEKSIKEINFNSSEDQFDMSRLPLKKDTPIVMYCDGTACWKSYKSVKMVIKAGYTSVYWFREGMPAWEAAKLPMLAMN
jgi:rhodanese-related sulfurtransferase/ABC-type phosphate/phosphonate transport system substrate-binding protein